MAELKFVTLVDPNGVEVEVTEPAAISNLVYGHGYKIKGNDSVPQAAEKLADNPATAAAILNEGTTKKS